MNSFLFYYAGHSSFHAYLTFFFLRCTLNPSLRIHSSSQRVNPCKHPPLIFHQPTLQPSPAYIFLITPTLSISALLHTMPSISVFSPLHKSHPFNLHTQAFSNSSTCSSDLRTTYLLHAETCKRNPQRRILYSPTQPASSNLRYTFPPAFLLNPLRSTPAISNAADLHRHTRNVQHKR